MLNAAPRNQNGKGDGPFETVRFAYDGQRLVPNGCAHC
jgi:hypothetical protein